MDNSEVAAVLYEIADLLELQGVSFKPQAYRRAARNIEQLDRPLSEVASEGKLGIMVGGPRETFDACLVGVAERFNAVFAVLQPEVRPRGVREGHARRRSRLSAALVTGAIAALAAAGRPVPAALASRRDAELAFGARLARAFEPRDELRRLARPDTPVCRCEDVAHGQLQALASSREAKLTTRAGMGPCQGRVCGPALGLVRGWPEGTVRPPLAPTPLAVLAQAAEGTADEGHRTGKL